MRSPGCPFCGMPPLDGEPCCDDVFKRRVMREARRHAECAEKENERLRALLPKAFDAGVAWRDELREWFEPAPVGLGCRDRDAWVAQALEGKC